MAIGTRAKNNQKDYYAISKGSKTGIWKNWLECKKHCIGVKGNSYKGFPNYELAVTYLKEAGITEIINHFSDNDKFFDESLDYTVAQSPNRLLVTPKGTGKEVTPKGTLLNNSSNMSTPNQKGQHIAPFLHSTPNQPTANGKPGITFNPTVKSYANATLTQTNHDTIMSILSDIKQELIAQGLKLEDLTRNQSSMDHRISDLTCHIRKEQPVITKAIQEIESQNNNLTTVQGQLMKGITTVTDQNSLIQHKIDAIDFLLDETTVLPKLKKKSPLLPTPQCVNQHQLESSFKVQTIHQNTTSQSTHISIPDRTPHHASSRHPQALQPTNNTALPQPHQASYHNSKPNHAVNRNPQSGTTHPHATEVFNTSLKVIHPDCTKLVIGDSVCQGMYPSKRDSLAVRTLYNGSFQHLAKSISQLPTNTVVRDICLLAGGDMIANSDTNEINFNQLDSEYHQLICTIHNTFPRAYISTCSLLPNLASYMIPSALRLCEVIRGVASHYRYTRYLDILNCLITPTMHQNHLLFAENNFLNKRGSNLIRNEFLYHINQWKSEQA